MCGSFHGIHKGLRYSYSLPKGMLLGNLEGRSCFPVSRSYLAFPGGIFEILLLI